MNAPTLDACLSAAAVARAYRELKTDPAPWRPHQPRALFELRGLELVLELVAELRANRYRADAMQHFSIAKADGSRRMLSALCKRDKFAQKFVAIGLESACEQLFHHDSFGYRPGRNVQQALARSRERLRMGLNWLVDADIQAFFDSIPHGPLMDCFRAFNKDPALNRLIEQWLSIGTYTRSFLDGARGIPQGAVVSPLLCNLYLHRFDQALSKAGLPFVRYADDFLIFAPDQASAERAQIFAGRALGKLKLDLKAEKTRIVKASPNVRFLGEILGTG